jgi:hypothetical protein
MFLISITAERRRPGSGAASARHGHSTNKTWRKIVPRLSLNVVFLPVNDSRSEVLEGLYSAAGT